MTRKKREVVVECHDLRKIYDTGKIQVEALKGVDVKVRKGEMVAIMGPSGCGKTTLLNCLSGIDDINDGAVYIEGTDISTMSDDKKTEYRGKRVGFIFQSYNLIPVLTAIENIELPLLVSGTPFKKAREKAMETLALVGLEGNEDHLPNELSGGQQQRVAIGRSLVNDPAIIFGDEPTGNLDTKNSDQIMALLCDLNIKLNQTYIIVTHDPRVASHADRIVNMESGRIKNTRNGISCAERKERAKAAAN